MYIGVLEERGLHIAVLVEENTFMHNVMLLLYYAKGRLFESKKTIAYIYKCICL